VWIRPASKHLKECQILEDYQGKYNEVNKAPGQPAVEKPAEDIPGRLDPHVVDCIY